MVPKRQFPLISTNETKTRETNEKKKKDRRRKNTKNEKKITENKLWKQRNINFNFEHYWLCNN